MTSLRIDPQAVASAHDTMGDEYDDLDDLWYSWLFSQIHEFIADRLLPPELGRRHALDIGAGTGFQSFLLARAGYDVLGIDIAEGLLEVARGKTAKHAQPPLLAPELFNATPLATWIPAHHAKIARRLEALRKGRGISAPNFQVGSVLDFPFEPESADVIVCCGSVLSFVDEYPAAIARLAKTLRSGGRLFLEVEQRVNPDLVWPLMDRFLGGRLEYGQSWTKTWENLTAPRSHSVRIDYPFELANGTNITFPLWLFSTRELTDLFSANGLRILDRIGIHQLTNLIPSTILHGDSPAPWVRRVFDLLRSLEQRAARTWPAWRLGCSVIFCLTRP